MQDGFITVAASSLPIRVADCAYNAALAAQAVAEAAGRGAALLALPELCLTGYTCGDLFLHQTLLRGALEGLETVRAATAAHPGMLVLAGLPLAVAGQLYNCAAVLCGGELLGLVPKTAIPNYSEFYERRHFAPAPAETQTLELLGRRVPFGSRLLFQARQLPEMVVGCELCEDLWTPQPPSGGLALAGATVLVNLSASNEAVGKADYRRLLVRSQSARLMAGYVYCSAGEGESTQDLVFSGHQMIAENGALLADRCDPAAAMLCSELDLQRLLSERRRAGSGAFGTDARYTTIPFDLTLRQTHLTRYVDPHPFVPAGEADRSSRCEDILRIQVGGLKKRLAHTGCKTAVIGVSGGLDSTLALLVAVRAFDALGLDRRGVLAVTMPCYGTTGRTRSNAHRLAQELGVTLREIPIGEAVAVHFRDIGLADGDRSVTYENGQARERTQVLMDLANAAGGMVVGTGDLSELALGWATYNGDHMSMYGVNAGVPKTLVRHIVGFCAREAGSEALRQTLLDILATPVSPELLPPAEGDISQKTEELVGPYELHDFFLYCAVRWGFPPAKVYRLARYALGGSYDDETILRWLKTFYRRFFSQQFKRSCLPDGPKVGTVSLSPRGDWRMPSDASAALWQAELDRL